MRAEVVVAGTALPAASAVLLRLDGDPLANPSFEHLLADGDDAPGELVTQNQGTGDDEVADPAMPVVVSVGAADTYGGNFDQHLVAGHGRCGHLLNAECLNVGEDAGAHRLGNGGWGGSAGSLSHGCKSLSRSFSHCGSVSNAWLGLGPTKKADDQRMV